MCGLVLAAGRESLNPLSFVKQGGVIQAHRGPDAAVVEEFDVGGCKVAIGHQRLSILDLSAAGNQPMTSASGRFVIAINGEVYNYLELRAQFGLQGLRSSSDTEVALELIEKIGPEQAFREFNGMWALVVLDKVERKLYLSRDRFGKKPLHWMMKGDCLCVASEAKVLIKELGAGFKVDALAASRYLIQSLQDIDDRTWVEGIRSFPAASYAVVDLTGAVPTMGPPRRYWSMQEGAINGSIDDYVDMVRSTVEDAIRLRLRSDVPVGVALSGGLDSSIIAALVAREQDNAGHPVRFFSAVSPGRVEDESRFIDMMGAHTGIHVEKVELEARLERDFPELIERTTFHNDAPIASFSNILFYLLMQRAHEFGIKVIYSGQGADEAFCGYRKYPMFEAKRLARAGRWLDAAAFTLPFLMRGTVFAQFNFAEAKRYSGRMDHSILGELPRNAHRDEPLGTFVDMSARQLEDIEKYSVPYLTHYEDRMSMAWAREIRAPFLDYRVVEMGVRAPVSFKLRGGWTKYCLRKAFESRLPSKITWRKDKQGFVSPQDDWLRRKLVGQVEAMIADRDSPVFAEGLVDRDAYRALFTQYLQGQGRIWFREAFAPFALDVWLRVFRAWV